MEMMDAYPSVVQFFKSDRNNTCIQFLPVKGIRCFVFQMLKIFTICLRKAVRRKHKLCYLNFSKTRGSSSVSSCTFVSTSTCWENPCSSQYFVTGL